MKKQNLIFLNIYSITFLFLFLGQILPKPPFYWNQDMNIESEPPVNRCLRISRWLKTS